MKPFANAPFRRVMPFFALAVLGLAILCGQASSAPPPGTVMAWGYGVNGQIGDGTPLEAVLNKKWYTYVAVQGLDGVIAIAAGHEHSLAVKSDGTVWAWGLNIAGQIGDGGGVQRTAPVRVPNLTGVSAVAGGSLHSLAVKSDGTVLAWGSNLFGEQGRALQALPNNLPDINKEPTQIQDLTGVAAVAAGENYSLALKADGSVWAWGINTFGQLGNGAADGEPANPQDRPKAHPKPAQVQGLSRIVAIAAGASHALALDTEGTVWAWGRSDQGQTGFPEPKEPSAYFLEPGPGGKPRPKDTEVLKREASRAMPSRVAGLGKVKAIAAGDKSSLGLAADGTVWAWGANTPRKSDPLERALRSQEAEDTQLGLMASSRPVKVPELGGVDIITLSDGSALHLTTGYIQTPDGTLYHQQGLRPTYPLDPAPAKTADYVAKTLALMAH
jgi:alpha-tubulin suppressor-like RCC1 family protein